MKELCVVHLVRAHNGTEPFKRFLESYRKNPGGIEHDLLIVFKGFKDPRATEVYRALLATLPYLSLEISDEGFDITAYFAAFRNFSEQYRYFCFLNSHSEILDETWLNKMHKHIIHPDVGVVGATASYQSHRGWLPLWIALPVIIKEHILIHRKENIFEKFIWVFRSSFQRLRFNQHFDPTPNYHLRTNAFMISGELMKKIECPPLKTKWDSYKFESASNGFSKQIFNMGKKIIVVGRDGVGYDKEEWDKSRTFRYGDQENLLVADNQTQEYQGASIKRRRYLFKTTWSRGFLHKIQRESVF